MFGIIICLINNVREGDLDFANEIDDLGASEIAHCSSRMLTGLRTCHTSGSKPFVQLPLTCPKEMDGLDCDDRTRGR